MKKALLMLALLALAGYSFAQGYDHCQDGKQNVDEECVDGGGRDCFDCMEGDSELAALRSAFSIEAPVFGKFIDVKLSLPMGSLDESHVKMRVMDYSGKQVLAGDIPNTAGVNVQTKTLKSGSYWVVLESKRGRIVEKVVIE